MYLKAQLLMLLQAKACESFCSPVSKQLGFTTGCATFPITWQNSTKGKAEQLYKKCG